MKNHACLLENRHTEAAQRFDAFSALSMRQFSACGLAAGWHCREVGANPADHFPRRINQRT